MKAIAFVDYENIWNGLAERGQKLIPEEFVQVLERYAEYIQVDLQAVYLYANFDKEEFWRTQTAFEKKSVFARHTYGKNSYANTDIRQNAADLELMLEAQEILLTRPSAVDIFLLFTGDGDFFPLVRRIRAWGKEVRIIGVNRVNHLLHPYCESFDVFCDLLEKDSTQYNPAEDLEEGIKIISEMQIRLPYVASTRARVMLSKKLGRSLSEIKELVQYMVTRNIILEQEHYDPNLLIQKTKIYLLNLDNPVTKEVLGERLEEIRSRYSRL